MTLSLDDLSLLSDVAADRLPIDKMGQVPAAVDRLIRYCQKCLAAIGELQRDIDRLRADNQLHRQKADGEYWAWQGDGEDHLESLVCPVLIPAAELRKLQALNESLANRVAAQSELLSKRAERKEP